MKLTDEYILGLVDGEGCFTFTTSNSRYSNGEVIVRKIPAFEIIMHVRDKELIEGMRDHLKLKNRVYIHKPYTADGVKRGLTVKLIVREFASLKNIIIPFFYKKLHGFKGKQFIAWLEKIGSDPAVPESYKLFYRLYKSGWWDKQISA